ncbi:hypothetical protein [Embleya sp. NBC_00896]|uniref:hypothetical protein n=1 Tax=Embleya sp. NBC_00896 TaxID=2975961 RepID=UPI002F9092F2|nr:hypothetical protein OG928_48650 [Embleya sp. NBC_00896]
MSEQQRFTVNDFVVLAFIHDGTHKAPWAASFAGTVQAVLDAEGLDRRYVVVWAGQGEKYLPAEELVPAHHSQWPSQLSLYCPQCGYQTWAAVPGWPHHGPDAILTHDVHHCVGRPNTPIVVVPTTRQMWKIDYTHDGRSHHSRVSYSPQAVRDELARIERLEGAAVVRVRETLPARAERLIDPEDFRAQR